VAAWFEETVGGRIPPYPVISVPVLLGAVGGVSVALGCGGLLIEKRRAGAIWASAKARTQDFALLVALLAVAVSGLLVLLLRRTSDVGLFVTLHLGSVFALYVLAPYGKFVHAVYRAVAVLIDEQERIPT
jgi:citrate/tricarballylate utilization protein